MTSRTTDYALLAARTLTPKRSDPWPARKLARGITEPEAAWAALAPLLGPLAAGAASRSFERVPAGNDGKEPRPGVDVVAYPPTVAGCLAFATDTEGVVAAEELAREAMRRLLPFGVSPRERIVWSVIPEFPGAPQGGEPLFGAVYSCMDTSQAPKPTAMALGAAFRAAADAYGGEVLVRCDSLAAQKLCEPYVDAVGFAGRWARACAVGLPVPNYEYAPGKVVEAAGHLFSDLANPLEPLLELMLRGYWLSGATDDALVLVGTELGKR